MKKRTKKALVAVVMLFCCAPMVAQNKELARAILIEEQEHDLQKAVELYEQIVAAEDTAGMDRTKALLRWGRALQRLGDERKARAVLKRAAKGLGPDAKAAAALLQEPSKAKVKQLRAKARALLELHRKAGKNVSERLQWIGPEAVAEIVIERRTGSQKFDPLIWRLGGRHAQDFLRKVLEHPTTGLRQHMARQMTGELASDLVSLAERFLHDRGLSNDTTKYVARCLVSRVPIERLLAAMHTPKLSRYVWELLAANWRTGRMVDPERTMQKFLPALRTALEKTETEVAGAARLFLGKSALDTACGRSFCLEMLSQWSKFWSPTPLHEVTRTVRAIPAPAHFSEVVEAARKLGACREEDMRARWLRLFVHQIAARRWYRMLEEPAMARQAVELVKLGYWSAKIAPASFGSWLSQHADPAMAPHAIQVLDGTTTLCELVVAWPDARAPKQLPESAWPALRRAWEKISPGDRSRQTQRMLEWIGTTGHPRALPFLAKHARKSSRQYLLAAGAIAKYAGRKQSDEVRNVLRGLLSLEGMNEDSGWPKLGRNKIFAALLRLGDWDAVKLHPQLEAKGLKTDLGRQLAVVTTEFLNAEHPKFTVRAVEGAWRLAFHLNVPDVWPNAREVLGRSGRTNGSEQGVLGARDLLAFHDVKKTLVRVLYPVALDRLTREVSSETSKKLTRKDFQRLLHVVMELPVQVKWVGREYRQGLHRLVTLCLESRSVMFRGRAVEHLRKIGVASDHRERLVGLMADENVRVAAEAIKATLAHIRLKPEEMRSVLGMRNAARRVNAIQRLLPGWDQRGFTDRNILTDVLPLLKDKHANVREAACKFLQKNTDARAVPPLLATLRDPVEVVRNAAQAALQAIRFYHEQKAHWHKIASGRGVRGASASATLVKQTGPTEKKATRLLAIRSLGLIGDTQVLPVLIELTKEKDQDIARAATEAISTAHARASKGPPK